ncbi:MAG: DUF1186 domain-containing protein [bacterium]
MTQTELCNALRTRWYLTVEEIQAILSQKDFFQPYLRDALSRRATTGCNPDLEKPLDATDSHAIFLLTEMEDSSIIPDLLNCLRLPETSLRYLYADALTEHIWLSFARLGCGYFDDLWKFIQDTSVDKFARDAVIRGIIQMHRFHPSSRDAAVAFLRRLLGEPADFPEDYLAGILCDCANCGLMELREAALQFASTVDIDDRGWMVMANSEDVKRAFQNASKGWNISQHLNTVYDVNKVWKSWSDTRDKNELKHNVNKETEPEPSDQPITTKENLKTLNRLYII